MCDDCDNRYSEGEEVLDEGRVWFWRPQWYWHGWRTLIPFFMGEDEFGRRTAVFGWTITGRVIIALWKCQHPDCIAFLEGRDPA